MAKTPRGRQNKAPKTPAQPKTPKTAKRKMLKVQYKVGRKTYSFSRNLMQQIEMLQKSTKLCLRKLPFSRLCKEVGMECATYRDIRWDPKAIEALQEAAEIYLTNLFEDANILAQHAKRVTLYPVDMHVALYLRGNSDPGNK